MSCFASRQTDRPAVTEICSPEFLKCLSGMSFPSAFGSKVSSIMDALTKAAVAEITKLVEEGSVVLRLEVRRRDTEIQELRTRLNVMEAELCKAQEAAVRRATEEEERITGKDKNEANEVGVGYPELEPAELLCEAFSGLDETQHTSPVVKQEPEDEVHSTKTVDLAETQVVCSKAEDHGDCIWNSSCMFENTSVPVQHQVQMFPSHADQYSACRDAQNSLNSLLFSGEELADDCLTVPVKAEETMHPVSMGNTNPASVYNKEFGHDLYTGVVHDERIQSASQQAGPSAALSHRSTSESNKEDGIKSRIYIRTLRLTNMCKANQKVFICSECNKSFLYLAQLEQHKATHQTFKPFRCLECGKFFTQKTRLKTHQRVHTGERPFSCKICGKMFSRRDNCLRHERFHSGVKPYSCKQCGKSFTTLGKLKLHQEIHLLGR